MKKSNEMPGKECVDMLGFEKDLTRLINNYSIENLSNTPDYLLAKHLVQCLNNFNESTNSRDKWNGKE